MNISCLCLWGKAKPATFCWTSTNRESGRTAGRCNRFDLDVFDSRARRSSTNRPLDTEHRFVVSFDDRFDPSVRQVAYVAVDAFDAGMILDEEPESDALDVAADNEALRNNHWNT